MNRNPAPAFIAAALLLFAAWPQGCAPASGVRRDSPGDGQPARAAALSKSTLWAAGVPAVPDLPGIPDTGQLFQRRRTPPANPDLVVSPGEELWIIQRPTIITPRPPTDDAPGCGALVARIKGPDPEPEPVEVPVPLKHTAVEASIAGYLSTVNVTQTFHNPFEERIEAVYVFPLPQDASVSGFVMTIGDRRIRGILREREEAEEVYYEARRQGHTASLLTQERPNIFTQAVANIEPGREIDVDITYYHALPYADGWFQFVFPMVVGPRYNPPVVQASGPRHQHWRREPFREGVGAVPRGHDISLNIQIDAGVPILAIDCPTHDVSIDRTADGRASIALGRRDTVPNRDFVLRFRAAGDGPAATVLTHADPRHIEDGGFFSLMILPPADLGSLPVRPMDLVFVVDTSASMQGRPIQRAREAIEHTLQLLSPDDTFQIIRFSHSAWELSADPLPATRANVRRGLHQTRSLQASGGMEMISGVRAAFSSRPSPGRTRYVVFLTDGYIGNESQVLGELQRRVRGSRVFSVGIGPAVNRYLLERMATIGNGAAAYIAPDDDPRAVMDLFLNRASRPAMTDLKIDWGDLRVEDVYPASLPGLYVGRPIVLTGRFTRAGDGPVRVTGSAGGRKLSLQAPVNLDPAGPALAHAWARRHIAAMEDAQTRTTASWRSRRLADRIRTTALEFGIMSAYTAFVAVDAMSRADGPYAGTVQVPVPTPEGVSFESTVQDPDHPRRR